VPALKGDPQRGAEVFSKNCATCHQLNGVGHVVGPDLASLGDKSPQGITIAVLDPNRAVEARYVSYTATTKAGLTYTGVLGSETGNSVTIVAQDGKQQTILRTDLDELVSSGKSLMPEGLEKELSKQDLADLIAYLTDQGPPPKRLPGNDPAVVRPRGGALALLATNAEVRGGEITFEQPLKNVGMWHGAGDHVTWAVQLDRPGEFDVWLDWACADDSAGNAYVLEGARPDVRGRVAATGGWDRYRQAKVGTVSLTAGRHRLTLRPDGEPRRALMDLRGIHLVPKGQKPAPPGGS
jgi:putative heme-binding domain-containing protein